LDVASLAQFTGLVGRDHLLFITLREVIEMKWDSYPSVDKIDRFLRWVKVEYDITKWEDSDWLEIFEEWNKEHPQSCLGISELNEVKKRR
jgi:hypothetical protein